MLYGAPAYVSTRRYSPEDYGRRNAKLDKDLLDVVVQGLLIQVPRSLIVSGSSGSRIRGTAVGIDGTWLSREQLVQESLSSGQDLLRQFTDEVLSEFLKLLAMQSRQGFTNWRSQAHLRWLKESEILIIILLVDTSVG